MDIPIDIPDSLKGNFSKVIELVKKVSPDAISAKKKKAAAPPKKAPAKKTPAKKAAAKAKPTNKILVELLYRDADNYQDRFPIIIDLEKFPDAKSLKKDDDIHMGEYGTVPESKFFGSEIHLKEFDDDIDHDVLEIEKITSLVEPAKKAESAKEPAEKAPGKTTTAEKQKYWSAVFSKMNLECRARSGVILAVQTEVNSLRIERAK